MEFWAVSRSHVGWWKRACRTKGLHWGRVSRYTGGGACSQTPGGHTFATYIIDTRHTGPEFTHSIFCSGSRGFESQFSDVIMNCNPHNYCFANLRLEIHMSTLLLICQILLAPIPIPLIAQRCFIHLGWHFLEPVLETYGAPSIRNSDIRSYVDGLFLFCVSHLWLFLHRRRNKSVNELLLHSQEKIGTKRLQNVVIILESRNNCAIILQ